MELHNVNKHTDCIQMHTDLRYFKQSACLKSKTNVWVIPETFFDKICQNKIIINSLENCEETAGSVIRLRMRYIGLTRKY